MHGAGRHGTQRQAVFTGQSEPPDRSKYETVEHFRLVNAADAKFLSGGVEPMVIAALPSLAPIYRRVNTYEHLEIGSIDACIRIRLATTNFIARLEDRRAPFPDPRAAIAARLRSPCQTRSVGLHPAQDSAGRLRGARWPRRRLRPTPLAGALSIPPASSSCSPTSTLPLPKTCSIWPPSKRSVTAAECSTQFPGIGGHSRVGRRRVQIRRFRGPGRPGRREASMAKGC